MSFRTFASSRRWIIDTYDIRWPTRTQGAKTQYRKEIYITVHVEVDSYTVLEHSSFLLNATHEVSGIKVLAGSSSDNPVKKSHDGTTKRELYGKWRATALTTRFNGGKAIVSASLWRVEEKWTEYTITATDSLVIQPG